MSITNHTAIETVMNRLLEPSRTAELIEIDSTDGFEWNLAFEGQEFVRHALGK